MSGEGIAESAEVALLRAFLNTLDLRTFVLHGQRLPGGDALDTPAALTTWLAERGLIPYELTATAAELALARALRARLRAAVDPAEPRAPAMLGRDLARLVQVRIEPGRPPRLAPAGTGVAAALGALLTHALAAAEQGGGWQRLKTCPADDCRWVFYDRTKSSNGRWCETAHCGNRMKTRAYRARRRAPEL